MQRQFLYEENNVLQLNQTLNSWAICDYSSSKKYVEFSLHSILKSLSIISSIVAVPLICPA